MNSNEPIKNWKYRASTAEMFYCSVFQNYIEKMCSNRYLGIRENNIVAGIVRRNNYDLSKAFQVRDLVRQALRDHRSQFDRLRKGFLMLDSFPENNHRFKLTFEHCLEIYNKIPQD